jgi:hypothetical protein
MCYCKSFILNILSFSLCGDVFVLKSEKDGGRGEKPQECTPKEKKFSQNGSIGLKTLNFGLANAFPIFNRLACCG